MLTAAPRVSSEWLREQRQRWERKLEWLHFSKAINNCRYTTYRCFGRVSNKISSSALLSSPEQLDRQKQALLTFGRINLSSASIQHWQTCFWECSPQCSGAEPAWLWDYELEKGLWAVHTMDSILNNVGTNPCPVGRGSCSAHLLLHKSLLVFLALWTQLNWSFFIT